jgi:hypothetical protein
VVSDRHTHAGSKARTTAPFHRSTVAP